MGDQQTDAETEGGATMTRDEAIKWIKENGKKPAQMYYGTWCWDTPPPPMPRELPTQLYDALQGEHEYETELEAIEDLIQALMKT